MASDVSICSAALMLLGDSPIESLAENNRRAILCTAIYTHARDDILRAHPWNCLKTRVVLSPTGTTPAFGWTQEFNRPADWLRTLSVGDDSLGPDDYSFEGNKILARTDTLYLSYLARKDEGDWDAHLVQLMVKRMQMDLAYPITKSTSLREAVRAEIYTRGAGLLAQAKAVDGQENPPEDYGDTPLISVRG
jgi:hypothetical protein